MRSPQNDRSYTLYTGSVSSRVDRHDRAGSERSFDDRKSPRLKRPKPSRSYEKSYADDATSIYSGITPTLYTEFAETEYGGERRPPKEKEERKEKGRWVDLLMAMLLISWC